MGEKEIEKEMYDMGCKFLLERYNNQEGGVGVIRVETGEYYISVWNETNNTSVDLCAETGAILEAHKYNKVVTHSLCVVKEKDSTDIKILTPCGVCQERLYYWGGNVKCAISNPKNEIIFKKLSEIQPYYWLVDKR